MLFNRPIFILFLSVLCFFNATAKIPFAKVTLDDGLSQSHINCILQDSQGFIWFGTNGGLNRYDGYTFKVFLHAAGDEKTISNNIINTLFEDSQGKIWIGTQNGLSIYDPELNSFKNFKTDPADHRSISSNIVTSIVEDTVNKKMWIGTMGGGINLFEEHKGEFFQLTYIQQNPYSISSNNITSLVFDGHGFIWAGTSDLGLNMIDTKKNKCLRYINNDDADAIPSNEINTLYFDKNENLWIGTSIGLCKIDANPTQRSLEFREAVTRRPDQGNNLAGKSILSIYQGESGLLWVGTDNNGLYRFNPFSSTVYNYSFDASDPQGLLSNKIPAIFDDKVGILWIGTNSGINKIDIQGSRFEVFERDPSNQNTLSSNNVQSIYRENNGILWIGTFDGGLNMYDSRTNDFIVFNNHDLINAGVSMKEHYSILARNLSRNSRRYFKRPTLPLLSNNRILSIYRDKHRTLWVGTGGGGLNELKLSNKPEQISVRVYKASYDNPDSLSSNTINTIYEDNRGLIWIGTEEGGLNRFDRKTFKRFLNDEHDILSISSNNIRCITEDKYENLWIGTYDAGLNLYSRREEKFVRFMQEDGETNGISSNTIYCMKADQDGKLWIGTANGLNMMDIETRAIKAYNITDGLPSNFIYGIEIDSEKNIWVSTNKGISKFDVQSEKFKNYEKSDGLQGNEFNPNASYVSNNGHIYFGGLNGLNSFNPVAIVENEEVPDIVITDFKILNEEVPIGTENSPLLQHISFTKEIELGPDQNTISFEFTALNFTNSEKNQFKYILEPFETKWNEVGNRRFAHYTNIPAGEYTFRVIGSNNDGVWNEAGTSISIEIRPPFYNTIWFRILMFLSVIGSGYAAIYIRTKRLQKNQEILREKVFERTKELMEAKNGVEKAHAEISMQKNEIENQRNLLMKKHQELTVAKQKIDDANKELTEINQNLENLVDRRAAKLKETNAKLKETNKELDTFIYRASHDLKGPLARLLGLTLIAKMENSVESYKDYIKKIESGAFELDNILNKLINVHHINMEQPSPEKVEVKTVLDEQVMVACRNFEIGDIDYEFINNLKTEVIVDIALLKIIFGNIIENCLVFRRNANPKLLITAESFENCHMFTFYDNGIGITNEQQKKVFNMFYRGSEKSKGNGLGLYLVRKALEKIHGSISIKSDFGKYTEVKVILPSISEGHKDKPKIEIFSSN